ncbi:hypothetical protein HK101_007964 [Irineochytrium annulatum]|nr:hypothetical protein HK101_007964 [Irineochytrium annulatum]
MTMELSNTFSSLLGRSRKRPPSAPWTELAQPVPLVTVKQQPVANSSAIRYVATGISPEAEAILSQLPPPLHIIAFSGFGRSGKSYTASKLRAHLAGNNDHSFQSQPGNIPCTHGIDMIVFKNERGPGHILFLDCEGGANHNQTAIPFVIGLAARLSSRMYVFERGCFTTAGLDTVMQVINMGYATSTDDVDITRSLVLVENMSINQDIPDRRLLEDLLSEEEGDEMTNRVRRLIKSRFDVEFAKLPFNGGGNQILHDEACEAIAEVMVDKLQPFTVGNVAVDGTMVIQLVTELVTQIREGGNRFNMVTATEALVANMASEAANTVWSDFVDRIKKMGNHPSQISGRKHLRTILREMEGAANSCMNELEGFIGKLHPAEPALVAKTTWERNLRNFENDIRAAHTRKAEELAKYTQWGDRVNRLVTEIVSQIVEAIRQFIKFARFSTTLILMSNYYLWKHSVNLITGIAVSIARAPLAPVVITSQLDYFPRSLRLHPPVNRYIATMLFASFNRTLRALAMLRVMPEAVALPALGSGSKDAIVAKTPWTAPDYNNPPASDLDISRGADSGVSEVHGSRDRDIANGYEPEFGDGSDTASDTEKATPAIDIPGVAPSGIDGAVTAGADAVDGLVTMAVPKCSSHDQPEESRATVAIMEAADEGDTDDAYTENAGVIDHENTDSEDDNDDDGSTVDLEFDDADVFSPLSTTAPIHLPPRNPRKPFLYIPNEVLGRILLFARRCDLPNCALVSPLWRDEALRLIWRDVPVVVHGLSSPTKGQRPLTILQPGVSFTSPSKNRAPLARQALTPRSPFALSSSAGSDGTLFEMSASPTSNRGPVSPYAKYIRSLKVEVIFPSPDDRLACVKLARRLSALEDAVKGMAGVRDVTLDLELVPGDRAFGEDEEEDRDDADTADDDVGGMAVVGRRASSSFAGAWAGRKIWDNDDDELEAAYDSDGEELRGRHLSRSTRAAGPWRLVRRQFMRVMVAIAGMRSLKTVGVDVDFAGPVFAEEEDDGFDVEGEHAKEEAFWMENLFGGKVVEMMNGRMHRSV